MTRKTFLASIVSLGALALKPSAFVAAVRKLLKPEPEGISMRLISRYVPEQNRTDILHEFKFSFDEFVPCTQASPAEIAAFSRPPRYTDRMTVRILG